MNTSRKYYAGAYEKTVTVGGDTVERVRIGESVVHVKTTPAGMAAAPTSVFEYAHRDHLGSLESVTDAAGEELVVLAHDPYGERRKPDWTGRMTAEEIEALLRAQGERVSRGFTGHEHLDRTGLIHMNGRMYDPRLGRFLSPDPIVGDPTSSQSWNLYSYVGNNPLSYVDPTGLVRAGPMCPVGGAMLCMDGGGGSTARTVTVTETVYGVVAIPYGYSVPSWTRVWDRGLDHYVWDLSYDHYWAFEYRTFSYDVTRTILLEDHSVADEPATVGSTQPDGTEEDWYENWILPGPHGYVHVSDAFCRGCRMEAVVDALNRVAVHPNQKRPFVPGKDYIADVELPFFIGRDDVSVDAIYEGGRQVGVRNTALKNHGLYPGIVERRIIRDGDAFRIGTVGVGTGRLGGVNVFFHEGTWREVDNLVIRELGR